jgi:hypothetical protein
MNLEIEGGPSYNVDSISISRLTQTLFHSKKLVKVTDLIGREIKDKTKKLVLLYIYNDGTVERKYIID